MRHVIAEVPFVLHVLAGFGLTFVLGFERELRGSAAGDRTFSLIGVATAVLGALAVHGAAISLLSGAITGVGFLGAGLLFRQADQLTAVHGVTTAATIIAAAAIGAAAGAGELWVALAATGMVLLSLEIRYIPFVRVLDARRWSDHFRNDTDPHHVSQVSVTVTETEVDTPGRPQEQRVRRQSTGN